MQKIVVEIDNSIYENVIWFLNQLPKQKIHILDIDDTIYSKEDQLAFTKAEKEFDNGEFYSLEEAKQKLL